LILASLIESTCQFILINDLKKDETLFKNHSKWLEVIVDFMLNVNENKVSTKNEFLNTFSYSEAFKANELEFMYDLFDNCKSMNKYFLSKIQPACLKLSIKTYLLQYLERIQLDLFDHESESADNLALESFGRYLQNYIKTKEHFNETDNKHLNDLLQKMHNKYSNLLLEQTLRPNLIKEYLRVITECLHCLYAEDSVLYDDILLLEKMLSSLNMPFETKQFPFNNELLFKSFTYNFVNLNCIAYKSNLISNENLIKIYQSLLKVLHLFILPYILKYFRNLYYKDDELNGLVAYYSRFLFFFGFSDTLNWLGFLHSKWSKQITDFKLVKLKKKKIHLK